MGKSLEADEAETARYSTQRKKSPQEIIQIGNQQMRDDAPQSAGRPGYQKFGASIWTPTGFRWRHKRTLSGSNQMRQMGWLPDHADYFYCCVFSRIAFFSH